MRHSLNVYNLCTADAKCGVGTPTPRRIYTAVVEHTKAEIARMLTDPETSVKLLVRSDAPSTPPHP